MVRKVRALLVIVALFCAIGTTAHATSYTVYDGNISSTYLTYFRDIVSGIGFNDNYVLFRSGQYEYTMVVGKLTYSDGNFELDGTGKVYTIASDSSSSYNSFYTYDVTEITSLELNVSNKIIYSDVGAFPQLVDRGAKYEMLTVYILCCGLLGYLCGCIFKRR